MFVSQIQFGPTLSKDGDALSLLETNQIHSSEPNAALSVFSNAHRSTVNSLTFVIEWGSRTTVTMAVVRVRECIGMHTGISMEEVSFSQSRRCLQLIHCLRAGERTVKTWSLLVGSVLDF